MGGLEGPGMYQPSSLREKSELSVWCFLSERDWRLKAPTDAIAAGLEGSAYLSR